MAVLILDVKWLAMIDKKLWEWNIQQAIFWEQCRYLELTEPHSNAINRIIEKGLDQEIGFSKQSHFCLIAKQIKTGHSGGLFSNHRGKKTQSAPGTQKLEKTGEK